MTTLIGPGEHMPTRPRERTMMSARSKPLAITMALAITAVSMGVATSVPVAAAAPAWTTAFRDDFSGSSE